MEFLKRKQLLISRRIFWRTKTGSTLKLAGIPGLKISQILTSDLIARFKNFENAEKKVVCSWFQEDGSPLNQQEIDQAIKIMGWSRKDLLDLWHLIPDLVKSRKFEGERWTINEIFGHVANAEWWYLDRLGLANCAKDMLPIDPLKRLAQVRENFISVLPGLEKKYIVHEVEGEIWSPRKIIRRACWHEKDHLVHIQKIINR